MEKTKKSSRKTASASKDKFQHAYREFVLREGKEPASVFIFCKDLGLTENEFYESFGSFQAIAKEIWRSYITHTLKRFQADENAAVFTAREKILAFYFILAEELRKDRSFALHGLKDAHKSPLLSPELKAFKQEFEQWLEPVLAEGKQTGEIAPRPFLDKQYKSLFWIHLMFVLQFWAHDESTGFEKTDMAIEKSVNLAFDLIGKGVLDNALDFGKFLYQNSKN